MKKIFKILLALVLTFTFILFVKAEEDNSAEPTTSSQLEKQAESINRFCQNDETIPGCLYDDNNKLYTTTSKVTLYQENYSDRISKVKIVVPKGIELTRGYQAFDGQGNAVFAGCYRFEKTDDKSDDAGGVGTYFFFQMIVSNGKSCNVVINDLIPAKGVARYMRTGGMKKDPNGTYDGKSNLDGKKNVEYNGWVATNGGDCPKIFGYTANTKWYTSDTNKYIFLNDENDISVRTFSWIGKEEYVRRNGCTIVDVDGREEAMKLLDAELEDLRNNTCPTKIEDMSVYEEGLEKKLDNIVNNNKYQVLWAKRLEDNVIGGDVLDKVQEVFASKVSECKYKICNIDASKIKVIEDNKEEKCKKGCTFADKTISINTTLETDPEKGKCYLCSRDFNEGKEGIYYFVEKKPEGMSCDNVGRPQEQCFGTPSDQVCFSCYINAFKAAKLTKEQQVCMFQNELAAALTIENFNKKSEQTTAERIDKDLENSAELREKLFNHEYSELIELYVDNTPMLCSEILGPVLLQIVKGGITIIQIVGAIIAIVKGMLILVPAVVAKDADALKKASKTLVTLAIILVIIILFRPVVRIIGNLLEYDTSCIL